MKLTSWLQNFRLVSPANRKSPRREKSTQANGVRQINVESLEDRTLLAANLIGIDFGGGATPANWTGFSGTSDGTHNNLIDETGTPTLVDVSIDFDNTLQGGNELFNPPANELPNHAQSLAGIDRSFADQGNVQLTFTQLVPDQGYEFYIFAGDVFASSQRVQFFSPADTDNALLVFNQPHNANQLAINDEIGDSSRSLSSYAEIVSADANGELLIQIDSSAAPGGGFFGLAGIAFCEAGPQTPDVVIGDAIVSETDATATFPVSLTSPALDNVTLTLTTADGLATAGQDYTSTTTAVTILAGATTSSFDVPILNDSNAEVQETFTVSVQSVDAGTIGNSTDTGAGIINDDEAMLTLSVAASAISEMGGAQATTGTVTRNTPTTNALTVNLSSDDSSEATVPMTVTIPAGQTSVTFDVAAVNDTLVDGTQVVAITAIAAGHMNSSDTFDVTDDDVAALTVSIAAAAISEGDGPAATTGTVTRNSPTTTSLSVDLSSDDTAEATVPATVTIPAGQTSVTFDISAVNDLIVDGTQTVAVTATAVGHTSGSSTVDVTDNDAAALTVVIVADSFVESDGSAATTATVSHNGDSGTAVVVALLSDDTTSATVPTSITIPAGQTSATFDIDAVDDAVVDGTKTVTVTATASNFVAGSDMVDVTDNEFLALSVIITDDMISEGDGPTATTGSVARNGDTSSALTVNLSSSNIFRATVPATITIPAGQTFANFDIDAVDNTTFELVQTVTVTATATNFVSGSDSLDVTDDDAGVLSVVAAESGVSESAGPLATTVTVTRSSSTANSLLVTLSSSDLTAAVVPDTLLIPAGQASATFNLAAVDDNVVDGTQVAVITATAFGHFDGVGFVGVTDDEVPTLLLAITDSSVGENSGLAASTATLTRNTDTSNSLTVNLVVDDTTELSVPTSVTIPAGATSVVFDIDAVDDLIADGTKSVTITASALSHLNGIDTLDVTDNEVPVITITTASQTIDESDGASATTATVTRNSETLAALMVDLASDDTGEVSVPATVTIPAGETSLTFDVAAIDDGVVDGTQTVGITATATAHTPGSASMDVDDDDVPTLTVTIAATDISEDDGDLATTGTVTRNTPTNGDLVVTLHSDAMSEATVPSTVTIPDGLASVSFAIAAADDGVVDGTQSVSITATASGYVGGGATLNVLDDEVAILSIDFADSSINESDGAAATTATVTRNSATTSALTVNLTVNDSTAAALPPTITIPIGQASATFDVAAVDDDFVDGPQTVSVTATATGHQGAGGMLDVQDDDVASLTVVVSDSSVSEGAGTAAATATVTRNTPATGALIVILTSGDPTAVTVPVTAAIPVGQASVTFPITAVDDSLVDGTQTVVLVATAAGHTTGMGTLDVTDDDVAALTVSIAATSVDESAGATATSATITRNTDTTDALTVSLSSDDTTAVAVPATVIIPAGASSVVFDVAAVDDSLVDGAQQASIAATAVDHAAGTALLNVVDDDVAVITVAISDPSITENGGQTTATVSRNSDTTSPLTVTLLSDSTDEATVIGFVTIPAGQAVSSVFAINGVDDTTVDGTQTVTITASANAHDAGSATLDVTDDDTASLSLTIDLLAIAESGGIAVGTVSRNTLTIGDLSVALTSSNVSAATVPASVTIPDGSAEVSFSITGVDESIVDGTQSVSITAGAGVFQSAVGSIDVTDDDIPTLTVVLPSASLNESAGAAAMTAIVSRNTDTTSDLVVSLTSDDTSEATVPGIVTIPAGQASVAFDIDAVDDAIVDGTHVVSITAVVAGHVDGTDTVAVIDNEVPKLTVDIAAAFVAEAAGTSATTATVTRNSVTTSEVLVTLFSSDTTEATAPSTVLIPAGQTSVTIDIAAVDDAFFDGSQNVIITATASGHSTGVDGLAVTDDEIASLTLNVAALAVSESGGENATIATITRNSETDTDLNVTLVSSDTSEISVPAMVTIPAGQTSVTFDVAAVEDVIVDGTQTVTVAATAAGHVESSDTINVVDSDIAGLTVSLGSTSVSEAAGAGATTATVTRSTDVTDALSVALASDSSAVTIPTSVVIPAGETSISFAVDAVDNALVDGGRNAVITATATAHADGVALLGVTDDEVASLTVSVAAATIDEADGAAATTATISRNTGVTNDLVVSLASDDTTEVAVPKTVTIPAGQTSASFDLDAVNDSIVDGTQTVLISASADAHADGADSVDVTDLDGDTLLTVAITPNGITTTEDPIVFTFQFNNAVTAFDISDIMVTNGTPQKLTQVGADTFTLSVTPTSSGDVTVTSDAAVDSADNANENPSATVTSNVSQDSLPPSIVAPPVVTDDVRPTLSWASANGAASYEVWFARIAPSQSRLFASVSVVTGTTWTPDADLTPAMYRFWIRGIDSNGIAGRWSAAQTFNVRPTLVGPFGEIILNRPTFRWNAIENATGYQIFVRTKDPNAGVNGDIVVSDIPADQTSWVPTQNLPEGQIRWWVRAIDSIGNAGWSDVGLTDIQSRTSIISATANSFSWSTFPNTSRYILHVQSLDTNAVVVRDDNITSTSYTTADSLASGNYRAWVKAIDGTNQFNSGLWSRAFDFNVASSSDASLEENVLSAVSTLVLEASLRLEDQGVPSAGSADTDDALSHEKPVAFNASFQKEAEPRNGASHNIDTSSGSDVSLIDRLMGSPIAIAKTLMALA